jgi:hypothetical protein
MYGKSYESMYKGSMVGAGLHVFAVWNYIITMAQHGYIEVNPELLAFTLGGKDQDPRVIEEALEFLQQPDPESRSKAEDGRRLIKEGQYQYHVVNWAEYNRIRTEEERREYNRVMQAEHRRRLKEKEEKKARKKSHPSPGETAYVKAAASGASQEQLDNLVDRGNGKGLELDPEFGG